MTRFKEAQEIITAACKGRVVDLDISFRSTKEVIGLSNLIFTRLLASTEKPWEFGYKPVEVSENRADHKGSVELLLPPRGNDAAGTKRNEADMVARRIHSIVNAQPLSVYEEQPDHTFIEHPARYRRYRDPAGTANQSFILPFGPGRVRDILLCPRWHRVYHRQEVYDLCNILSFLEHQHDNVSLVGILRSPYFGLPDTELFRIAQERGITFWDKLGVYAKNIGPGLAASQARDLLGLWQQYACHVGLVALIRRILAESGVYTVYAALPASEQILANIEKLVAMARNREEAGLIPTR